MMRRVAALMIATLCALSVAVSIAVAPAEQGGPLDLVLSIMAFGVVAAFVGVGTVLVFKTALNLLPWLFIAVGAALAVIVGGENYAIRAVVEDPGSLPGGSGVLWLLTWAYIPMLVPLVVFLPLTFPTGRLLSRRWGPVAWAGVGVAIFSFFGNAFMPGPPLESYAGVPNPLAVPDLVPIWRVFQDLALACLALGGVGALTSMVVRYRRAGPEERRQLKWFLYAAALMPVPFIAYDFNQDLSNLLLVVTAPLLPIASGIAILRHRLYDIDLIINKTLVYVVITAFLGAGYFGAVVLLQAAFRPFIAGGDLAIAGSTLAVAAVFRPLRLRIQAFVDRRFYRRRYDAVKTLEGFSTRLRQEIDLQTLTGELGSVVDHAMQPVRVSLWVRGEAAPR